LPHADIGSNAARDDADALTLIDSLESLH